MAAKGFTEAQESTTLLSFEDYASQHEVSALYQTLEQGTYVHAYLISGMKGTGKRSLAMLVAQYLLCCADKEDAGLLADFDMPATRKPCGVCAGCMQVRSGNHPDLIVFGGGKHLEPKDAGKSGITVGDVREAIRIAGTHTYEGGLRVFVIHHAQSMTQQAQNSLLKTLEEPTQGNIFLLTTDAPSLLLPTIISRCRQVRLHAYPDSMILGLLSAYSITDAQKTVILHSCSGAPGVALQLASDEGFWKRRTDVLSDFFSVSERSQIVRISGKYKDAKDQADELLTEIEELCRALMLVRLGQLKADAVSDFDPSWQRMSHEAPLQDFTRLMDAVSEARRLRLSQVTWQAVTERLLFRLMEERNKWSM